MGESINPEVQLNLGAGLDSIRSALGTEEDVFVFANLRKDQVAQPDGRRRDNLAYVFLAKDQGTFENFLQNTPTDGAFSRQKQDYAEAQNDLQRDGRSERPSGSPSPLRSCCSSSTHVPVVAVAAEHRSTVTVLDVSVRITSISRPSRVAQHEESVVVREIDEITLEADYIPGDGDAEP